VETTTMHEGSFMWTAAATNAASYTVSPTTMWVDNTISVQPGRAFGQPIPLPSVVARHTEYANDRDAPLTPIEWLERQIDDVCLLARAA
jgi:hypothetical protein